MTVHSTFILMGTPWREITAEIKIKQNQMSKSVEYATFFYYRISFLLHRPVHPVKAMLNSFLLLNELCVLLLGGRSASSEDSAHLRFTFWLIATGGS